MLYLKQWYIFTIIYIGFDYARPQEYTPISLIKPMMILLLILLVYLILNRKLFFVPAIQIKLFWVFIVLYFFLVVFAHNKNFAFYTALNLLLLIPIVLSIINTISDLSKLKIFFYVMNALLIFVSIYGILHRGRGPGSFLTDENDLSLYINTWIPFSIFLFMEEKKKLWKYLYLMGVILGILVVIVSFSRGGFLGLMGVFFVAWAFSKNKFKSLIVVVLLGSIMLIFADEKYWAEMSTVTDTEEGTADERLLSWDAAWKMFLDKPWGVGGNNFPVNFSKYQPEELKRDMWGRVAHSLWFTLLPESGLVGTILFFLIIYYNIKDILYLRNTKASLAQDENYYFVSLSQAFLASYAGFFISATFISVLYYPHFYYMSGVLVATKNLSDMIEIA